MLNAEHIMEATAFTLQFGLFSFMVCGSINASPLIPVWEKDMETTDEFEARVCSRRCNGTDVVYPFVNHCFECFSCQCYEGCAKEGTCCPSVTHGWVPPPLHRTQCVPVMGTYNQEHIMLVVACDPDFPDGQDRGLCESRTFPKTRSTGIPVTSTANSVTYANVHCAICNYDDQDVVEWKVTCLHNQFLYNTTSDKQYDERALQMPDVCGVEAGDVEKNTLHYCDPGWYTSDVISTCNVTGHWAEEDHEVRTLCEESDWPRGSYVKNTESSSGGMFANVYCALCNAVSGGQANACLSGQMDTESITSTGMVTFLDESVTRNIVRALPQCADDQWPHPQGECRQVQCGAGKKLKEHACTTAVSRVRGLGYHLAILLQPVRLQTNSRRHPVDYSWALNEEIGRKLQSIDDFSVNITTAVIRGPSLDVFAETYQSWLDGLLKKRDNAAGIMYVFKPAPNEAKFLRAELQADVRAIMSERRDRFEERILQPLFQEEWIVDLGMWTVMLKAFDISSDLQRGGRTVSDLALYGTGIVDTKSYPYREPRSDLMGLESYFLPLNRRLVCPHLNFQRKDFQLDAPCDDCDVRFLFPEFLDSDLKPVSFRVKSYPDGAWLTEDGQLVMCLHTFQDFFPDNVTVRSVVNEENVSTARAVTSLVCSSVSVACLVLTFLTYALFRQLRSLPGLNNMGLSLSLAAAQLSQMLPSGRNPEKEAWCRAMGVARHWAWLVALGWMGVCCVHMARVFTAKTQRMLGSRRNREVRHAFLRNVLATLLLSSLTVALVATVCSVASGGSSPGYGGPMCFLDTGLHHLMPLAFVLPLVLVVVTNMSCFVVTVVAIARVRRLQSDLRPPSERRDVLVYVKLVTVTGGAWLLALISAVADREWLSVLAELLTCAQGVLLFWSYVCNARVWGLYRAKFLGKAGATSTSSSSSGNKPTTSLFVVSADTNDASASATSVVAKKSVETDDL